MPTYSSSSQSGSLPRAANMGMGRMGSGSVNEEKKVDWGNLSGEDKEVFFGWLDEFFERSYGIKAG
jgi:hypothetical protein